MTMTAQVAATRIVRELLASETEIDRALASSAALLATMAQARIDTGSPLATGQIAIMRLVRSLSSLTDARAEIVRAHGELLKIGDARADLPILPSDCQPLAVHHADAVPLRKAG